MTDAGQDASATLREAIQEANRNRSALRITGGGSKDFYGRAAPGAVLSTTAHRGIVAYRPEELVLTARAGTPLRDLETALAEAGQMLPFEPPHFGPGATLGGAVACGLSGPGRPWRGAVRDAVLGVRCLTGDGRLLSFGGQVMKNVAGYDLSRLMTGALGTLGVLLEVSVKVLPRPEAEANAGFEMNASRAIAHMNSLAATPLPLSGAFHHDRHCWLRLAGAAGAVEAARRQLGADVWQTKMTTWQDLREQRLAFFHDPRPLWRLSLAPATPVLDVPGKRLLDWGGAQRWLFTNAEPAVVRAAAAACGGHATLFRGGDRSGAIFHPLDPVTRTLHQRLKRSFDPQGILNPGRYSPEW